MQISVCLISGTNALEECSAVEAQPLSLVCCPCFSLHSLPHLTFCLFLWPIINALPPGQENPWIRPWIWHQIRHSLVHAGKHKEICRSCDFRASKIMTILRNDMIQNWPFTGKLAQLTWILLDEKQLIDMKITWLSAGYKSWEHVVLVRLVCNAVRRNVSLVSILLYFSFLNAVQISKFLKYWSRKEPFLT